MANEQRQKEKSASGGSEQILSTLAEISLESPKSESRRKVDVDNNTNEDENAGGSHGLGPDRVMSHSPSPPIDTKDSDSGPKSRRQIEIERIKKARREQEELVRRRIQIFKERAQREQELREQAKARRSSQSDSRSPDRRQHARPTPPKASERVKHRRQSAPEPVEPSPPPQPVDDERKALIRREDSPITTVSEPQVEAVTEEPAAPRRSSSPMSDETSDGGVPLKEANQQLQRRRIDTGQQEQEGQVQERDQGRQREGKQEQDYREELKRRQEQEHRKQEEHRREEEHMQLHRQEQKQTQPGGQSGGSSISTTPSVSPAFSASPQPPVATTREIGTDSKPSSEAGSDKMETARTDDTKTTVELRDYAESRIRKLEHDLEQIRARENILIQELEGLRQRSQEHDECRLKLAQAMDLAARSKAQQEQQMQQLHELHQVHQQLLHRQRRQTQQPSSASTTSTQEQEHHLARDAVGDTQQQRTGADSGSSMSGISSPLGQSRQRGRRTGRQVRGRQTRTTTRRTTRRRRRSTTTARGGRRRRRSPGGRAMVALFHEVARRPARRVGGRGRRRTSAATTRATTGRSRQQGARTRAQSRASSSTRVRTRTTHQTATNTRMATRRSSTRKSPNMQD